MSTYIGRSAEDAAAGFLHQKGFEILSQNWRTRWCEIDIVAQKDNVIHFVEVKFRSSPTAGSGLDYITPSKIKQLKRAALFWTNENNWEDDYQIDVIAVDGPSCRITYLENAIMG